MRREPWKEYVDSAGPEEASPKPSIPNSKRKKCSLNSETLISTIQRQLYSPNQGGTGNFLPLLLCLNPCRPLSRPGAHGPQATEEVVEGAAVRGDVSVLEFRLKLQAIMYAIV